MSMIQPQQRLYLTHRRRGNEDYCPRCCAPIKWIYDGSLWIPCSREPILCYPGQGYKKAVVNRRLRGDVWLYTDGRLAGLRPVSGHLPHVYDCTDYFDAKEI